MQAVVTAPRAAQTHNLHRCRRSFRRGYRARAAPSTRHHWRPRPDRQPVPGCVGRDVLAGACVPTSGPAGAVPVRVRSRSSAGLRWRRGRLWHPRRQHRPLRTGPGSGDRCEGRRFAPLARRIYVPGILSSQPSQVCPPAHGTVPERRANVQKGARPRGTDRRYSVPFRGSAGRRNDAGTRWLGCCPPEMSTGETHPRAKRPMNRAKTPLRRRAAPPPTTPLLRLAALWGRIHRLHLSLWFRAVPHSFTARRRLRAFATIAYMGIDSRTLGRLYQRAHNRMRDVDGFLPQEALDELLKFLLYKNYAETAAAEQWAERSLCDDPGLIRQTFSDALSSRSVWVRQLWQSGRFHLSDRTLLDLQHLFGHFRLADVPLDVRSAALRTFLNSDARKGLGIFLTPESVVRAMVQVASPKSTDVVLDPACGSGTFLMEAVQFFNGSEQSGAIPEVYGVDKNPRMLLLAEHNLGGQSGFLFRSACADSLRGVGQPDAFPLGLVPNTIDIVLTNPPFGVSVTRDTGVLDLFGRETLVESSTDRVPSEVLFVDLCLRLLRPGGCLGIVLPRSVLTNERLALQRQAIDRLGHLTDIIDLPTETFASTGTQTKTVAAFFRKHAETSRKESVSVRVCHVTNVGVDSTGRHREGNQLPSLATRFSDGEAVGEPTVIVYRNVPVREVLQRAPELLSKRHGRRQGKTLQKFVDIVNTGRTPARSAYTNNGTFIIKVGNLTGRGIDWEPRDRNFVSHEEGAKRAISGNLGLRQGDILLTSSAHASRYIAKKVDVLARIPEAYRNGGITFVGELIRIRPVQGISPYVLLAALRHPGVREDIQALVRGQTAHLHPRDILDVVLPFDLYDPAEEIAELAILLRREADLAFELNSIAMESSRRLSGAVR